MATIVDYQYIPEVSTLDALHNLASDTTNWYSQELPWVNTFLINWANQITNIPEWWSWIAWWSTNINRYSSAYNKIAWGSWYVYLPDWTSISISSWSANLSATTYLYVDQSNWSVYSTTTASDAVWEWKILLCVAAPTSSWKDCSFQAFGTNKQSTFIHADNIAANTITGNEIAANTITANELDVSYLSAISANLGTVTAWDISWTTVTAWSTSSWAVKLYPYSNTRWRLEFYQGWSLVWYMWWYNISGLWWVLYISDSSYTTYTSSKVWCAGKLRIPVWTDLYW